MLESRPNTLGLVLASLVQSVPLPSQTSRRVDPCHVAGEDAPLWLAINFAAVGTMIAVASASVWQQSRFVPPSPPVAAVSAEPSRQLQPSALASTIPASAREAMMPTPPQPSPEPLQPSPSPAETAAPAPWPTPVTATTISPPTPVAVPERQTAAECFRPLSIPFERNSSRPAPNDMRKALAVLRQFLSRHRGATVLVEGHSDASGNEDLNVLLSYSRAKTIAGQIKNAGIPAQQISIRAAGSGEALGGSRMLASDRSAIVRIAGGDDCQAPGTATKAP